MKIEIFVQKEFLQFVTAFIFFSVAVTDFFILAISSDKKNKHKNLPPENFLHFTDDFYYEIF